MRRWRRARSWKKRAVAVLAVLFLSVGIVGGRMRPERILQNAVCTISPAVGYVLDQADEEGSDVMLDEGGNADAVSGSWEAEGSPGELLAQELEMFLLAEQSGQTVSDMLFFPEDEDEAMEAITEWDADLLAEIDRENEAMRQLAEQQAQSELLQNPQGQAGQNSAGTGQDSAGAGQGGTGGTQDGTGDAAQTATQPLALPYSMEQLNSLDFLVTNLYNVNKTTRVSAGLLDASTLLAQDMRLQNPDSGGPKILIHHTHATEYFADSDEKDEATLIVGVGDYLEELLETQYGIEVIHDRTVYPYNEAYSQALKNVENILAENPTIEVFIDLHRDAGGTKKYTVDVNGKETANLMFFNGLSHNVNGPIDYLTNDNLDENLAFSFQLKMAGDSLYPGLCKRNYLKAYRYNLHVLPRAVIVEVGDNNNTLQEAKNAMEPLARILYYVLTGEY